MTENDSNVNLYFSELEHIEEANPLNIDWNHYFNSAMNLRMINYSDGRKTILFDNKLHRALGRPTSVQFAKKDENLIIGEQLPGATFSYNFQPVLKRVIGKKEIICWIESKFNITVYEKTSVYFNDIVIVKPKNGSKPYAVVKMNKHSGCIELPQKRSKPYLKLVFFNLLYFSIGLHDMLGNPTSIQILKDNKKLIIGEKLEEVENRFYFQKKKKTTIHSKHLLGWIQDNFNIPRNGKRSRNFYDFKIVNPKNGSKPYAIFKIE